MAVLRPQDPIGSVKAIAQMHMDRSMQAYGFLLKSFSDFFFVHLIHFALLFLKCLLVYLVLAVSHL